MQACSAITNIHTHTYTCSSLLQSKWIEVFLSVLMVYVFKRSAAQRWHGSLRSENMHSSISRVSESRHVLISLRAGSTGLRRATLVPQLTSFFWLAPGFPVGPRVPPRLPSKPRTRPPRFTSPCQFGVPPLSHLVFLVLPHICLLSRLRLAPAALWEALGGRCSSCLELQLFYTHLHSVLTVWCCSNEAEFNSSFWLMIKGAAALVGFDVCACVHVSW